ncbi:hypothetical protein FKM82_030348 [Ascaphus truei]
MPSERNLIFLQTSINTNLCYPISILPSLKLNKISSNMQQLYQFTMTQKTASLTLPVVYGFYTAYLTETILTKITDDLHAAKDRYHYTLLILLNLSAAFAITDTLL